MIYYHNSNYPEIIRFRQEFFKKQHNNNKISILRPLQLLLSTNCCCFLYSPPLLSFFFRLRTQLIAGSLISLFFYYSPLFLWWKNDIKSYILPPSFIITNPPFIDRPPYNQLFLHEKTCFITQYHYCYFSHFVLQKQNKTKKHTRRKKLWWQLFHTWIKQQKWFYYLSLYIYYFLLVFNTRWLETVRL